MDRIEWVLVRKDLLESFPEINPSNYDDDDACELNRWGVELVTSAVPSPPAEQASGEHVEVVETLRNIRRRFRGDTADTIALDAAITALSQRPVWLGIDWAAGYGPAAKQALGDEP